MSVVINSSVAGGGGTTVSGISDVPGLEAALDGKLGADQAIVPSALPDNGVGTDDLIIQRASAVYTQTRDSLFVGKGAEVFTWAGKPSASGNTNRVITVLDSGLVGQFWSDGTYWRCLKEVSLLANGNPATTTSGTTETVLATIPLPALALADNGKVVVEFLVTYPNNANNKTVNLRLGGTGINGTSLWEQTATTTVKMSVRCGFMNRNSVSSQVQTALEYGFGFGQAALALRTAVVDTSVATSLFLTGTCANGADLITLQSITATVL